MSVSSFLEHLRSAAARAAGLDAVPTHGSASPSASASPPPLPRPNVQHASTSSLRSLTWLGSEVRLRLDHGTLDIRSPLAYVHAYPLPAGEHESSAINLRLPIAHTPQAPSDESLGYWPRYDKLTPAQRRTYLQWLAEGRRQAPSDIGYAFLFLYGLERRALLDRQDIRLICKEVLRLRRLYEKPDQPVNASFEHATSTLIGCLLLREFESFDAADFEAFGQSLARWDDDRIAWARSWLSRSNRPVPGWFAFAIAARSPASQQSVVARRVGAQLRELFLKRYRDRFGEGIVLNPATRNAKFAFRASSPTLRTIEVESAAPSGGRKLFRPLSDIWNDCINDLRPLSTLAAKGAGGELSVKSWNALPAELRSGVDHPLIDRFSRFIEEHTADRPHTIVPARALATLVGVAPQTKLTAAASRRMTEVIDQVGYCIEPDPRITGRSYGDDESIILFLNLDDGAIDARRFMVAAMMLDVGLALARADGQLAERDLLLLSQHIDSAFQLNAHEQRRLEMLRALRIEHGAELSTVAKPLRRLPQPDRERVAKFALAMVVADGVITREELKALRRLYTALGFDRADADAAIASLSLSASDPDAPVSVLPATPGAAGEAIPPLPDAQSPPSLRLDRAAIDAILRDTSEVARMLADAMNVDTEPPPADDSPPVASSSLVAIEPVEITVSSPEAANGAAALPEQYVAFYRELIGRTQWTRSDLALLASQHELMLAGAVDAVNEWSTETNGGPLVYEDGDQFTLETEYCHKE